ncbi:hydroxymethylpyrimidine kinase/phosphomethylpyrimidine kinase/thiamine-phosphate diphosphorylase [Microbacterium resistens]|uniref:Thiamine-phosphate synthase n=1 Tax=Microbacterium resistens TaxID=156977 RepID=A0ABU1S7C6_9MICO|nr:bifunctional hydroxymethylpyrimidine kinase/phosphomethylpyrimidine kinase [Microbacterium resistens]MDR6865425.1 hydroxymethylpyrimidine kinase/phosphomethylpyrimidine kinase/thiamine-phosphate diphosphorylase [Microbacterium resistens]
MTRAIDLSLYLVTDTRLCGRRGVPAVVDAAVSGGARIVQLRDKDATDEEFLALLVELAAVIDGRALLVVDDRLDVVVEARRRGARVDGVHLGQSDASVLRARELLGPDAIVGLTANTAAHLEAARALPPGTVDYLGVGAIHPTTTKPDHPPVLGVEGFAALAAVSPLPCVAIGGITEDDAAPLRRAGAAGLAVVSALCAAADPRAAATRLVRAWRDAPTPSPIAPPPIAPSPIVPSPITGPPRVLSIAGTDPSGGAGIQADIKSISANGGYAMTAITALVAQNTRGVREIHRPPSDFLRAQLDAVSDDIVVDAVKIGMLADTGIIRVVRSWLEEHRPPTIVLDPVMVATSGDRLLDAEAEEALRGLLPLVDVVTPNLPELAMLAQEEVAATWDDALAQAVRVAGRSGTLVLVKGGHLDGDDAPDALVEPGGGISLFPGERIRTRSTHGTGCSLSSALATRRARGAAWPDAVAESRAWLRESIIAGSTLGVGGGHGPVHHFAGLWSRGGLETRPTADAVAADWWDRIARVRAGIDGLPFIRALADGDLPRSAFLFYLEQDALYLREYARTLAEAARTAPTSAQQAFWAGAARDAIAGELELHASWLGTAAYADSDGAGSSGAEAFGAEPAPATVAYLDHLRSAAFSGEHGVLIAALLPCFWLYADLGARLHGGAFGTRPQDPDHPYASWLATYADPGFEEANRRAIGFVAETAAGADPRTRERMRLAFERSVVYERAFFAAPMPNPMPAPMPDPMPAPILVPGVTPAGGDRRR